MAAPQPPWLPMSPTTTFKHPLIFFFCKHSQQFSHLWCNSFTRKSTTLILFQFLIMFQRGFPCLNFKPNKSRFSVASYRLCGNLGMFTWKSSSKQDECFQYLKLPHAIPGQAYKISEIQKQNTCPTLLQRAQKCKRVILIPAHLPTGCSCLSAWALLRVWDFLMLPCSPCLHLPHPGITGL